jgi:peptidoglycan hydrolase-like protein with peptidoglycan-binding domain
MLRKALVFSFSIILLVSLTGCATTRRKKDLETQGLRNQILVLEAQLQSKDEEINNLKESLTKAQEAPQQEVSVKRTGKKRIIGEVKSRPNAKQIQIALENAGYNPGHIDGKMGKQTRDAIKAFQGANGLAADGKVGKQTWNLLRGYLYKKIK